MPSSGLPTTTGQPLAVGSVQRTSVSGLCRRLLWSIAYRATRWRSSRSSTCAASVSLGEATDGTKSRCVVVDTKDDGRRIELLRRWCEALVDECYRSLLAPRRERTRLSIADALSDWPVST